LLKKLGYIFDYLVLGINNKGIIKKVYNQDKIMLRFHEIKKEIEIDHYGSELEQLFASISKTIQNEEKLIAFLHSYKMFGLYFTGLYVPFQSKGVELQTRETMLYDFENQAVEEKIISNEENGTFTFNISLNHSPEHIEKYTGTIKTAYNRVLMGYLEIQTQDINIKYNTSWVG
jgi:glutamate-1-semialdehyde aminotransferase